MATATRGACEFCGRKVMLYLSAVGRTAWMVRRHRLPCRRDEKSACPGSYLPPATGTSATPPAGDPR